MNYFVCFFLLSLIALIANAKKLAPQKSQNKFQLGRILYEAKAIKGIFIFKNKQKTHFFTKVIKIFKSLSNLEVLSIHEQRAHIGVHTIFRVHSCTKNSNQLGGFSFKRTIRKRSK